MVKKHIGIMQMCFFLNQQPTLEVEAAGLVATHPRQQPTLEVMVRRVIATYPRGRIATYPRGRGKSNQQPTLEVGSEVGSERKEAAWIQSSRISIKSILE